MSAKPDYDRILALEYEVGLREPEPRPKLPRWASVAVEMKRDRLIAANTQRNPPPQQQPK